MKFKPGDLVLCINNDGHFTLQEGKLYKIFACDSRGFYIGKNDKREHYTLSWRFVPATKLHEFLYGEGDE